MAERIPQLQSEDVALDLEQVEARLRAGVRAEAALPNELAAYLVGSGGKRLRPLLMLLSFRGFKSAPGSRPRAQIDDIYTLAAVSEWVHTATLFHDDVLDASPTRRDRAAAHILHGNKVAILVGDFVYAEAFALLMDRGLLEPSRALASTIKSLVQGELLQHRLVLDRSLDLNVYDQVAKAKTASLFSWCTETGAWAAGLLDFATAGRFGLELGFAFQIADDYFDTYGFDAVTCSTEALDQWCESAPPLAMAIVAQDSPEARELWSALPAASPEGKRAKVGRLLEILRERSVIDSCQRRIDASLDAAQKALDSLGGNSSLEEALNLIRDRARTGYKLALASARGH